MIRNRNMTKDAKARQVNYSIDLSAHPAAHVCVLYDANRDIKINSVTLIYSTASDTGTNPDIEVGISTDPDKYINYTLLDSQSAWTTATGTLLSTALVAAGTPIVVGLSGTSTNTAVVDVIIEYEYTDVLE